MSESIVLSISKKWKIITIALLLLLLMIAFSLGYLFFKINNLKIAEPVDFSKLQESVLAEVDDRIKNIDGKIKAIENNTGSTEVDIQFGKKQLELAEIFLNILSDHASAKDLLKTAKSTFTDDDLLKLIDQDIVAIEKIAKEDLESKWILLGDILSKSSKLTYQQTKIEQKEEITEKQEDRAWQEVPKKLWERMIKKVVIKDRTELTKEITRRNSAELLKQHFMLLIQQARVAFLLKDQDKYQQSIQLAVDLFKQNFFSEDEVAIKIDELLKEAQQVNWSEEKIKLTSLKRVNNLE